jgi:hypothetical protein
MKLIQAIYKIQNAGMQVLLEGDPKYADTGLRAYAWSDANGYECYITVPVGVYDHLDDDEVAVLERVIADKESERVVAHQCRLASIATSHAA